MKNDFRDSLRALKRDKRFLPLIRKHGPPDFARPNLRPGNVFQSLVRSIVYQQVSGKAAASILARFVALFSTVGTVRFPTPEDIGAMPIETMRGAGLSAQKAGYIKDLAEKFSDGTIRHRALHHMPSAEVIEHLMQVKGIGMWTVHMFLIFTLGRPDVLPTGDLGIRKGFQVLYKLKDLPDHTQMEKLAEGWRAHASTASWYLWRAADSARPKPRAKEGEAKL